jgi:uncharacterized membrane protein YraQ (UPF0718 family)
MPQIGGIILAIGLLLTFVPPESIQKVFGTGKFVLSTVVAALLGSVTLIPGFVAFPLVGSFVKMGVSIVPAAAFLTTLTMVGFVTFPIEKQEFGLKFALLRNVFSFIAALLIAVAIGLVVDGILRR